MTGHADFSDHISDVGVSSHLFDISLPHVGNLSTLHVSFLSLLIIINGGRHLISP